MRIIKKSGHVVTVEAENERELCYKVGEFIEFESQDWKVNGKEGAKLILER